MNSGTYINKTASRVLRIVMLAMFYALMVAPRGGMPQQSKHVPETFVRERISTLTRDIISRGHHEANGIKIWIRSLPSNEELDEVRGYGETAIPVLTDYLKSKEIHERELAMRFLGQLVACTSDIASGQLDSFCRVTI